MFSTLDYYSYFGTNNIEHYEDLPTTTFLTFGNQGFRNSLQRIQNEARALPFDKILGYNEEDLKSIPEFWDRHKEFMETNTRGYGYWLWKAFLTWHTLRSMNEGEILVYADAGCSINGNLHLFREDIHQAKNNSSGIVSWSTWNKERTWTKMDLLNKMNALELMNHEQIHATFFIIKCTPQTIELTKQWYETGCDYHMIDDTPSQLPNDSSFREHRHDQSIFSILRNRHGTDIYHHNHFIKDTRIRN